MFFKIKNQQNDKKLHSINFSDEILNSNDGNS